MDLPQLDPTPKIGAHIGTDHGTSIGADCGIGTDHGTSIGAYGTAFECAPCSPCPHTEARLDAHGADAGKDHQHR